METIPFGTRLTEILSARKRGPAWLAKRAGIEASTVSRYLHDERIPTLGTLDLIAPILEMSVEELVSGTNAAERARVGPEFVPIGQYHQVVGTMLEFERKANDSDALRRDAQQCLSDEKNARKAAQTELREVQEQLKSTTEANLRLEKKATEYREALEKAVSDIFTLNAHLDALARTGQTTKVLAAIAAITGTATVAHYLGKKKAPRNPKAKNA